MAIPFYDLAQETRALRAELDRAYRRVMDRGWFVLGQEVAAFEGEFAAYCGARECVGVANGLDALKISLRAIGVGQGDEVIVAAHTFVATWLAIAAVGAKPVPCEPDVGKATISATSAEVLLTPRTRAILPVHLYGFPAPLAELAALCGLHGLHLVEDAAQAHGARSDGLTCGSVGVVGCFSFYPSKNLGAFGDAGAIVVSDPALALRLRRLRNYGSSEKYRVEEEGWNSRLDEMQAAFLRVKIAHLDAANASRVRLAQAYRERLAGLDGVASIEPDARDAPVWHVFVIRARERDRLRASLAEAGIDTAIHYPIPIYRMPPFRDFGPRQETESDRLAQQVLSLPFWPDMPVDVIDRVCDVIRAFSRSPRQLGGGEAGASPKLAANLCLVRRRASRLSSEKIGASAGRATVT
jgi:dTDP-3-amino-3,4,6-trideoxy-alpha-D-glucose transaminase